MRGDVIKHLNDSLKSLVLYHYDASCASQKVRLYMAEMNIPYAAQHIDLSKQEQITSNYRDINPAGFFPALVDNLTDERKVICGSTSVMLYLNECFCDKEKQTPDHLIKQTILFCKDHEILHDPHIRILTYNYLFEHSKKSSEEIESLKAISKAHPDRGRGEFLARAFAGEFSKEAIDMARKAIGDALLKIESLLGHSATQKYLFGDGYTMADAAATATLFRIVKISHGALCGYPKTIAYYKRMRALPSFLIADLK